MKLIVFMLLTISCIALELEPNSIVYKYELGDTLQIREYKVTVTTQIYDGSIKYRVFAINADTTFIIKENNYE